MIIVITSTTIIAIISIIPPPPPASISRRGAELEAALFDALPAVAGWREPFTEEVHDQIRLPRHLGGTHLQPPSESAA